MPENHSYKAVGRTFKPTSASLNFLAYLIQGHEEYLGTWLHPAGQGAASDLNTTKPWSSPASAAWTL